MSSIAGERLDILLSLNKLVDVEVRDERGITKLIIPIASNNIQLTEFGSIYLRLVAFPVSNSTFGASHALKQSLPLKDRWKTNKLVIGSIYPHGHFDYYDGVAAQQASQRAIKKKEKEREQKYKGLDF